jgi:hypothetical protein
MAPPRQTNNGLMIYIHSTTEIDIDIELTKAKIKLIKDKIAERIMFRSTKNYKKNSGNTLISQPFALILWLNLA